MSLQSKMNHGRFFQRKHTLQMLPTGSYDLPKNRVPVPPHRPLDFSSPTRIVYFFLLLWLSPKGLFLLIGVILFRSSHVRALYDLQQQHTHFTVKIFVKRRYSFVLYLNKKRGKGHLFRHDDNLFRSCKIEK